MLKKFLTVVLTICLCLPIFNETCLAQIWDYRFYDYLGSGSGNVIENSDSSWIAKIDKIGYSNVDSIIISKSRRVDKGQKYYIHAEFISSKINKNIFIRISNGENYAYGKWIKLIVGEKFVLDEYFIADNSADGLYISLGGDFGGITDSVKYSYYHDKRLDCSVNENSSTTISCKNFILEEAGKTVKRGKIKSIKKINNKTINVKYNKIRNAKLYNIQYSTNKKFKKKKTITTSKTSLKIKKLKPGKTYYIRIRGYISTEKGKWSAMKKIRL